MGVALIRLKTLRNAEVDEFGVSVFRDKDIGGRQIAVDDKVFVRVGDRRANILENVEPGVK